MTLDALIHFYQTLSPESISRFAEFYGDDAFFKDPFNEVRGLPAIQKIYRHMFDRVADPRFFVTGKIADNDGAVLVWEFHFRVRFWRKYKAQHIRGISHLRFDAGGRVNYHRDYWDAAEELYAKLPIAGLLLRGLRKALSATK